MGVTKTYQGALMIYIILAPKKNTRLGDRYNMQMINGRKKDMYDLSWR